MYSIRVFIPVLGMLLITFSACTPEPTETVVDGECQEVFGGDICTWGKMIGDKVVQVGATIPMSTIENAPMEGEMVFPPVADARIPFPSDVIAKTGINHLGLNWELHGHPPAPFLTPHFDFHFYTRSGEEIEGIDCSDESKPDVLPATYVLPDEVIPGLGTLVGTCVPDMGMHAMPEADVNATELFDATMIVGYYHTEVISVEPMIAKAKLMEEQSFAMDVPTVNDSGVAGWPAGFEAVYDEATRSYQFVFTIGNGE